MLQATTTISNDVEELEVSAAQVATVYMILTVPECMKELRASDGGRGA
jgi:hypothetical protein